MTKRQLSWAVIFNQVQPPPNSQSYIIQLHQHGREYFYSVHTKLMPKLFKTLIYKSTSHYRKKFYLFPRTALKLEVSALCRTCIFVTCVLKVNSLSFTGKQGQKRAFTGNLRLHQHFYFELTSPRLKAFLAARRNRSESSQSCNKENCYARLPINSSFTNSAAYITDSSSPGWHIFMSVCIVPQSPWHKWHKWHKWTVLLNK